MDYTPTQPASSLLEGALSALLAAAKDHPGALVDLLLSNSSDHISLITPDSTILYLNRTLGRLTIAEVLGTKLYDYLPAHQHGDVAQAIHTCVLTGLGAELDQSVLLPDGSQHWMRSRFIPLPRNGDTEHIFVITTDTTRLQGALNDLGNSRQQLHAMITSTPLAAMVWDAQYRTSEWNPAAERIFGWTREEALGREFTDLIVPEQERDNRKQQFDKALASGHIHKYPPYENRTKDGRHIVCEWWSTTLKGANGKTIGVASFAQDVTEKVRAERELQHAKQEAETSARAKSLFLANMSHEIRTPLNGIIGLLDLMQDNERSGEHQQYFKALSQSAQSLLGIVNDVLDFSRLEAGAVQVECHPVNVNEILRNIFHLMQPLAIRKSLRFELSGLPETEAWQLGDAQRLTQIVSNLVANAIKFTEHGFVRMDTRIQPPPGSELPTLEILVTDSGIGIAEHHLEQIFADFTQADNSITRRFGGSGLGLTISKRLAEMMGGRIDVSSAVGIGSTFTLRIPCRAVRQPATNIPAPPTPGRYSGRLLIVDDNPINLQVGTKMLERLGFDVITATGGQQALDLVATGIPLDAILLDIQMPEVDGYSVTRRLRESIAHERLPIIAMTANVLETEREHCLRAGMNGFIAKPFTRDTLTRELDRWLAP